MWLLLAAVVGVGISIVIFVEDNSFILDPGSDASTVRHKELGHGPVVASGRGPAPAGCGASDDSSDSFVMRILRTPCPYQYDGVASVDGTIRVKYATRTLAIIGCAELGEDDIVVCISPAVRNFQPALITAHLTFPVVSPIRTINDLALRLPLIIVGQDSAKVDLAIEFPVEYIDYRIYTTVKFERFIVQAWGCEINVGDRTLGAITVPSSICAGPFADAGIWVYPIGPALPSPFTNHLFPHSASTFIRSEVRIDGIVYPHSRLTGTLRQSAGDQPHMIEAEFTAEQRGLIMSLKDADLRDCLIGVVHGSSASDFLHKHELDLDLPIEWLHLHERAGQPRVNSPAPVSGEFSPLANILDTQKGLIHTLVNYDQMFPEDAPCLDCPSEVARRYFVVAQNGANTLLPPVNEGGRDGEARSFPLKSPPVPTPIVQIQVPSGVCLDTGSSLILAIHVVCRGEEQTSRHLYTDGNGAIHELPRLPIHRGSRWLGLYDVPADGRVALSRLPLDAEWWPVGIMTTVSVDWQERKTLPNWIEGLSLGASSAEVMIRDALRFHPEVTDIEVDSRGHLIFRPARGYSVSASNIVQMEYVRAR